MLKGAVPWMELRLRPERRTGRLQNLSARQDTEVTRGELQTFLAFAKLQHHNENRRESLSESRSNVADEDSSNDDQSSA
jgi:hypothetical protein